MKNGLQSDFIAVKLLSLCSFMREIFYVLRPPLNHWNLFELLLCFVWKCVNVSVCLCSSVSDGNVITIFALFMSDTEAFRKAL